MSTDPLSTLLRAMRPPRRPEPLTPSYLDDVGPPPSSVASATNPGGVPLNEVLTLLQQSVPGAKGMFVRDGRLFVVHEQPLTDEVRASSRALLADERRLSTAKPAAARAIEPTLADLRAQVMDAALTDEAWLRAFRRYQVAKLKAEGTESAPLPRRGGEETR
jgi:hypothetical protein